MMYNALQKQSLYESEDPDYEDLDTLEEGDEASEIDYIMTLTQAAYEAGANSYSYAEGEFVASFDGKEEITDFLDSIKDHDGLESYEVTMEDEDTEDMVEVELEDLADDALGYFEVSVELHGDLVNSDDQLQEAFKTMSHHGKKIKRLVHKDGFVGNASTGKYRKMTSQELRARRMAGKKSAKKNRAAMVRGKKKFQNVNARVQRQIHH